MHLQLLSTVGTCFSRQVRLALVILWEKRKGDASPRAGLLGSLPAAHDPPWRWDVDSLALLQYSPLAHVVRTRPSTLSDCCAHSFCSMLCHQVSLQWGRQPRPRVLQALQQRAQWREVFEDLRRTTPGPC